MTEVDRAAAPEAEIARVAASARRVHTSCGSGQMLWLIWGNGPALLLLHGNFGSWTHWVRNVLALARFCTVIVPDTPGFGESALPPSDGTPRAIAEVVANGLVAIVPPEQKVTIVGFSYGGRLAGELAALLGDRVSQMVGVAPAGLGIDDSVRRPGVAKLKPNMTAGEVAGVHRQNLAVLMIADEGAVDDLAVHIHDTNTRRSRFRLSAWTEEDRQSSLAKVLPHVRVPVKGIWADRDAFAGETLQHRLNVVWQIQPDAEIRMLHGVGHWMQYEAAERFNALLLDMLRGAA